MTEPLQGPLAPPMANGEVVFEVPWQGRVFGMAHTLADQGIFTWDDFRARLIATIAAADRRRAETPAAPPFAYYDCFLEALEALLAERGLVAPGRLRNRLAELEARPHGHDHPPGEGHQSSVR